MHDLKIKIRVKVATDNHNFWLRQLPKQSPFWGRCEFIFDSQCNNYDWFVVYNDLPGTYLQENLCCDLAHTLLITTEPFSIKCYGRSFTSQFSHVLTSQPEWALPHPGRIFSQPALQWFYGRGLKSNHNYDDMVNFPPFEKSKCISTVCSSKKQRHTLHNKRYHFVQQLKKLLPDLDVFGHGVRPIDDKAEALDPYKYHIAIENYIGEHHWTEKLSDSFLGCCLPFYCGCPNAADYFPPESFIALNIRDPQKAAQSIREAIANGEYERRLPAILEARRLILEKYNFFSVLSSIIENCHDPSLTISSRHEILSRRLLRRQNPLVAAKDFLEKSKIRIISVISAKNSIS